MEQNVTSTLSKSEQYKQDIIKFLSNRITHAVGSKHYIFEKMSEVMPQRFEVNSVSDELDKVTFISGEENTVLNFHWHDRTDPKFPRMRKFHLYNVD